jgi:hypothetical protein
VRSLDWLFAAVFAGMSALGCAPDQPPRWAEGGTPLVLAPARWNRGGNDPIELRPDGKVLEDGRLIFMVDRVGRVVDDHYDAVAVLLPDGRLAGTDNTFLGQIGVTNASPPEAGQAWLTVMPNGQVIFFDSDGERSSGGAWAGCEGPVHRTCTLVTHLVVLKSYLRRPQSGVGVGMGVGVGVGAGVGVGVGVGY